MAYSMTKTTAWLDNSNNANKLRQSYLKGFLDISGGPVYLRADNSFNLYTAENPTSPTFSIGPKFMTVIDASNSAVTRDISTSKLSFIHDLSENVTAAFKEIRARFAGSGSTTTTDFTATGDSRVQGNSKIDGDSEIGGQLLVSGNAALRQNLSVDGNVSIGSQLDVAGNARFMGKSNYFAGDVEINGNETINAQLFVEGDAYLKGRVYVTKDALFYADVRTIGKVDAASGLFTMEDVSANRNLRIGGISTLGDKVTITKNGLDVTGPSTLTGALNVTGASALTGTLGVSALATLESLEVTNNATIKHDLSVLGNTSTKKLTVVGDSSLTGAFGVTGPSTLTGALGVTGASTLTGTLGVSALATLESLEVTNDATIKHDLSVLGNTSTKKLTVVGDSSLTGAFGVTGASTLTGTLGVSALATLDSLSVTNNATVEKEFFVNGNTNTKKLTVTGEAIVSDKATLNSLEVTTSSDLKTTLRVRGATTMNSDLTVDTNAKVMVDFDVSGDTHVQDIAVDGNIIMGATKTFTTGSLYLSDSDHNTPSCIGTTEGNLTIKPNLPTDWVHIKSNLVVDGSINFTGSMIYTDVQVNVSEELDISANGPNYVLRATQNGGIQQDIAIFKNAAAADPVFLVGKNQTVCVNKLEATPNFAFDVSGASKFSAILDVSGSATFRSDMGVIGNYSSAAGNITLTNGNITAPQATVSASKLAISSTADISGDVTIYGNLILKGSSNQDYIDQSFAW